MNIGYSDENETQAVIFFIVVFILITGFGFTIGWAVGYNNAEINIDKKMCERLYSNTNDYLQCNTKGVYENVKLIQYIK